MTRTMLVASPGGHLDELRILIDLLHIDTSEALWVTGRTAQTESLLESEDVAWLPRVGSGEMRKAALALPAAVKLHRRFRPDLVVTTGALFSTPHLAAASLFGCETWFIDSATRVDAPSRTGVFARRFTRAKLFAQGEGWGDDHWGHVPSVFDAFEAIPRDPPVSAESLRSAVVSLGTELWPFQRALARVLELLPDTDIYWQTGVTEAVRAGHPLQQWVPANDLRRAIGDADVVITHAGVGSALVALDEGAVPVILPRRQKHGEMIDDHQVEFAEMLSAHSLAVSVDPADLSLDHLLRAANLAVRRVG